MTGNGTPAPTIRSLLETSGITGAELGRAIGRDKWEINRRIRGDTRWTARDVLRFHRYLKSRHVRHSLLGLLVMCAWGER